MRLFWLLTLLMGFTLVLPGCYGGGYQDPEIPEDYEDMADPEVLRKSMGGGQGGPPRPGSGR